MLLRIMVERGLNECGQWRYLVTPIYRLPSGTVVSVPDDKGWPTRQEAMAEADEIHARAMAAQAARESAELTKGS